MSKNIKRFGMNVILTPYQITQASRLTAIVEQRCEELGIEFSNFQERFGKKDHHPNNHYWHIIDKRKTTVGDIIVETVDKGDVWTDTRGILREEVKKYWPKCSISKHKILLEYKLSTKDKILRADHPNSSEFDLSYWQERDAVDLPEYSELHPGFGTRISDLELFKIALEDYQQETTRWELMKNPYGWAKKQL